MNSHLKYIVHSVMPIRNVSPGFGTPLFTTEDNSKLFIHEFNTKEIITDFSPLDIAGNIALEKMCEQKVVKRGEQALFAFCTKNEGALIGTRKELIKNLNQEYKKLDEYPFIQLQVAKFIQDDQLIKSCEKRTNELLTLRELSSYKSITDAAVRAFEKLKWININNQTFYKVYPGKHRPITLFDDYAQEEEFGVFEQLVNAKHRLNLREPDPMMYRPPSWALNSFIHLKPGGGIFNEGGTGAMYCASSVKHGIQKSVSELGKYFTPEDDSLVFQVGQLSLSGLFCDARGLENKYPPSTRNNLEFTQLIGHLIKNKGGDGVIYEEHSEAELISCVFRPRSIVNAEIVGSVNYNLASDTWQYVEDTNYL